MKYGWIPDRPSKDDKYYHVPNALLFSPLPDTVDLRPQCPPVFDQGDLGSCTANAIAAALEFDELKQRLPLSIRSRLFIYYNERSMEHTINSDSGAMIKDGIKSVVKLGCCSEQEWPYVIPQFTARPPDACYQDAKQHKALSYQRVPRNALHMKSVLASGYPFVFGITVYASFEDSAVMKSGDVPMPGDGEQELGGHALLCVGYDSARDVFRFMNSWGDSYGDKGFGTIPAQYLLSTEMADDFWVIQTVA